LKFNFAWCHFLKFAIPDEGAGKKGMGYKTQMGTTLSSCSHFVAFELLQPRRQATVMWLVAFSSSSCLRILLIYFCNPSLSGFAFYSITFRLSIGSSLRSNFPDGAFYRMQCGSSLSISTSAAWNISGFAAFLFPEIIEETFVSFSFSGFLLNLLMNDWRFSG